MFLILGAERERQRERERERESGQRRHERERGGKKTVCSYLSGSDYHYHVASMRIVPAAQGSTCHSQFRLVCEEQAEKRACVSGSF